MNRRHTKSVDRKSACDLGGLIPPAELFDRPLPRLFIIDADRPFEERVERAWQHIRATRFTPEEHARLREMLAQLIASNKREER